MEEAKEFTVKFSANSATMVDSEHATKEVKPWFDFSKKIGKPPMPDSDSENEDEEVKNLKKMKMESVHAISDRVRTQQDHFIKKYEEIKDKIDKDYGLGNGDYEIFESVSELAPERKPFDEEQRQAIQKLVDSIVFFIDLLYQNKPYQRFFVLETIARVPYFSYISCLHFLETVGQLKQDNKW